MKLFKIFFQMKICGFKWAFAPLPPSIRCARKAASKMSKWMRRIRILSRCHLFTPECNICAEHHRQQQQHTSRIFPLHFHYFVHFICGWLAGELKVLDALNTVTSIGCASTWDSQSKRWSWQFCRYVNGLSAPQKCTEKWAGSVKWTTSDTKR